MNEDLSAILSSGDEARVADYIRQCHENRNFTRGYLTGRAYLADSVWQKATSDLLDHLSICAFYSGHADESLEIATHLLDYRNLTDDTRQRIEKNRHFSIPYVADFYRAYPETIVERITNRPKRNKPRVTFTITTCRRPDLFIRTMNSFLHCCLDVETIDEWICVDDNTDEESRALMERLYPFFNFIWKDPSVKGHANSMNFIREMAQTPYIFHCEDDWQFFSPKGFISDALSILEEDAAIGQILVNKNYGEEPEDYRIQGGIPKVSQTGIHYYLHEHIQGPSRFTGWHNTYWPHFSLRPSLLRREVFDRVGEFNEQSEHFEIDYAHRYVRAGFVSGFFNTLYCLHIGRLTRDRADTTKANAYLLNSEAQFGIKSRAIRVKPITWWCSSEELCYRLNKQSKGGGVWNNIQLCSDSDADLFVILQHPADREVFDPERSILLQTELAGPHSGPYICARTLSDFPAAPDWHLGLSYLELSAGIEIKKENGLSAIVSSKYSDPGHIKRIDFLKYYETLHDVPAIDIYGFDNLHNFDSYRGALPLFEKKDGLLPYRYTFAAENHAVPNYFTEKIVDAILAESLCFYWGCPNLEKFIDSRAFIRIDLDDPPQAALTIKEAMENDEWAKRIPFIRNEKQRIMNSSHFFPVIERITEELSLPFYFVNLDRRPDRWLKQKERLAPHWTYFFRFAAVDGANLQWTNEIARLFTINDFGYRRSFMANALSHLRLWKQLAEDPAHNQYAIFEDDVEFAKDFRSKILSVLNSLRATEWDIVFLGCSIRRNLRNEKEHDPNSSELRLELLSEKEWPEFSRRWLGGMFGYLISQKCAKQLYRMAFEQGIPHGLDYWVVRLFPTFRFYFAVPHMVYTEYADPDPAAHPVDSDIQYDFEILTPPE